MANVLSRDRWTDAALEVLAHAGVEAVRVEPLARRLGVTKGSFYWHFRDRRALLDAMLARWEDVATQSIIDTVEAVQGPALARLRALFELATTTSRMDVETALREWSRYEPRVRRVIKRVDGRRMEYLCRLFEAGGYGRDDAEARSFLAYASLFGNYFIDVPGVSLAAKGMLDRCSAILVGVSGRPARSSSPPRGPVAARRSAR